MAGLNMSVGLDIQSLINKAKKAEGILTKLNAMSQIHGEFSVKGLDKFSKELISSKSIIDSFVGKLKIGKDVFDFKGVKSSSKEVENILRSINKYGTRGIKLNDKKVNTTSLSGLVSALQVAQKEATDLDRKLVYLSGVQEKYRNGFTNGKGLRSNLSENILGAEETVRGLKVLQQETGAYSKQLQIAESRLNSLRKAQEILKLQSRKSTDAQFMGYVNSVSSAKPNPELYRLNEYYRDLERTGGRYSDVLERINYLEKERANTSLLDKKISQLNKEYSVVGKLITAWKNYAKIARKHGDTAGEQSARQKVADLQRQQITLRNLAEEERARIRATNQNNSLLNDQGRLLGKLRTLAANYLSVFAVVDFGRKIVETTGYFEQQKVALQGILRSAAAAQKALNELKGMAIESPFELKDLVGYTKQLSAYGIEVENLLPVTKQLADLSTGLGVDMGRLILAYGQVKSASVLRGQELRQFTEAGIPMVQALADKFTQLNGQLVTTGEVFNLISERKVPFEMVASVLSDMTKEGGAFYKMQENITDTLYGQVQKLKDLWTISLNDMGSGIGGILRGFVSMLQGLVKNIRAVMYAISGVAVVNVLKLIRKEFIGIRTDIIRAYGSMQAFNAQIKAAHGLMAKLKVAAKGIGAALKSNLIVAALSAISGAIINAIQKSKEFGNSLTEIEKSFAKDTAKYIQGFDSLIGKLSSMTEGTKEYNEALDTLKSNYGSFVNPALINQLIAERKQLDDTAEGWGRLRDSVVAAIQAKKEYEMHEALKENAGSSAVENSKSLKSLFGKDLTNRISGAKYIQDNNLLNYDVKKYGGDLGLYNRIYGDIQHGNAESAFDFAKNTFIANDFTTKDQLKSEIQRSFTNSGVSKEVTKYVLDNIDKIWEDLSDTKEFKEYLHQHEINENAPQKVIERRFEQAQRTTAGRQEGRWVEGMSNADYNPAKLAHAEDYDYAVAVRDLIGNISQTIAEKRNAGESGTLFVGGEEGVGKYEEALAAFNAQVTGISEGSFEAADKTKAIAEALQGLANTINNSDLRNRIDFITGKFTQLAGTKTGRAASISTAIEKDFLGSGELPHETKDIYKRYVPTDATVDEIRNGIKAEYDRLENEIKSYGGKQGNEANAEYVKSLKEQQKILKTLAGEKYYDIDLSKQTGGGAVSIKTELNDFINNLKKAYETYKNATQKGGVEMGLGYVRNDKQFQEMFGQYFGGKDNEAFEEKLGNVKIGDKSVSTMIQDKFISGGAEDGIMDFEEAAKEVAKELMEYYKADKEHRAAFKTASEQLTRWIESTISKDNLNVALEKLEKEVKDLCLSFEKTAKMVDLYRKLMENGTDDTQGKNTGVTRNDVTTPASVHQRKNMQAVVGKYNEQVAAMSGGQGTPFEIGSLNNIADVYKALDNIGELRKMNGENFAATELGQTTSVVESQLQSLLGTMIKEIGSISGRQYTGNTLEDMIANSHIDQRVRNANYEEAQNTSIAHGEGFDYEAIKTYLEGNKADATAMYDQFLKDNRFDTFAKDNLGNIDMGKLESKFNEMLDGVPGELRSELESKWTDLKLSVQEYNSSRGALGSFGSAFRTYRDADKIAKAEYDQTQGRATTIQQQLQSGTNVLTGAPLTLQETIALNAELASCNEKLEAMGTNGQNLAKDIKQVSLKHMDSSLSAANKSLDSMSNAVTSVVSAAKAMVSAFNNVYDAMNDGENPEWMQQAESFLGDFGETFEQLIAPIGAVIAMIAALTTTFAVCETVAWPLLIVMLALIAAAAVIAAIVAAFKAHDNALEAANEALTKKIGDTENAMKNLNAAAERMTGFDAFGTKMDALGKNLEIYQDQMQQMANEEAKKNTDEDKVKEYKQSAQESLDEFLNGLKDMRDELTESVESWADSISSALRSAFQNGENAARAMKSAVNEMIGDMIENMLKMAVLEPLLQNAMDSFLGGSVEDIQKKYTDKDGKFDSKGYTDYLKSLYKSTDKVNQFKEDVDNAGTATLDIINSLPEEIRKYLNFNSDRSSLSSGIESITEDTARTLEGLFNSQLGVTIQIRQLLEDYVNGSGNGGSGSTNATMVSIQTHVGAINSNVALILQGLNEVRDTQVRPIHVTMV